MDMDRNMELVEDFWRVPEGGRHVPSHEIIKYMTYNRFVLVKGRLRIDEQGTIHSGVPDPYDKVSDWANHRMAAAMAAVIVGTFVAVEEAMVLFEGRSKQKVTIKTKPTPTRLKVWLLGAYGYILQWIWHSPGAKWDPVSVERQL
ncbi:unnamed protein product [Clonostachys solani]|uniref:PiggyBac transposable element-derived protein domain-containing protein n=1 Tax=Clonostachys solani TaxID=160281 RepID=A0A9N9ZHU5_9HYPO|nr:unnamed protein product [Clonostachys solani]